MIKQIFMYLVKQGFIYLELIAKTSSAECTALRYYSYFYNSLGSCILWAWTCKEENAESLKEYSQGLSIETSRNVTERNKLPSLFLTLQFDECASAYFKRIYLLLNFCQVPTNVSLAEVRKWWKQVGTPLSDCSYSK